MANRSQQSRKFVLLKLDFLEQQRSHVHDVVDTYVNKVVDKTKGWLDNTGDQQLTSQDLNQLIDSAVMFLVDKATQIQDEDERTLTEARDTEMSSALETQKTPLSDLPLSLASDSAGGAIKELTARLEILEKKLQSKGEELENVSAKQAEMGEKLGEIKTDHSDQGGNFEHILSQISSMETKLGDLTKSLEAAKKSQETMITDVESKVDSLSEKMKDRVAEDLNGQMKTVSGKAAEEKEEMSDGDKKLADQIRDVENRLSDVLGKVTENDSAIQKMSEKITEIDVITEELSEKIDKTQEEDGQKMRQLENKVLVVKRRWKKNFKDVVTRYDNVELQYKMVCSIVADRLLGLEKLRDILNKKILARDQIAKANLPSIGFTAHAHCTLQGTFRGDIHIIKHYQTVESNHGLHFDQYTGRFTAPRDGKYCVRFSTEQREYNLRLHHVKVSDKTDLDIGCTDQSKYDRWVKEETCEVKLSVGDFLYLKCFLQYGLVPSPNLSVTVAFSVSCVE